MSREATLPSPRIFYGWLVVAAAFAVTFVGFGCAYTFSAFVEPLQRDRSLRLPPSRRRRHGPDRPWPYGRKCGAQSD